MTGDFILPYFFQYISETLYPTTVEFDTLLNGRLAIMFISTKVIKITAKAVQSRGGTHFQLIVHLDVIPSYYNIV